MLRPPSLPLPETPTCTCTCIVSQRSIKHLYKFAPNKIQGQIYKDWNEPPNGAAFCEDTNNSPWPPNDTPEQTRPQFWHLNLGNKIAIEHPDRSIMCQICTNGHSCWLRAKNDLMKRDKGKENKQTGTKKTELAVLTAEVQRRTAKLQK